MLNDLGLGSTPEIDILIKAVDQTQGAFNSVSGGLGVLSAAALAASAVIVGVGAAIVSVVKTTMDWGLSLDDVQKVMGGTADQAAGLKLSADALGISTDLITNKMVLLAKGLENSKDMAGASGNELEKLGINFRNTDGTLMNSNELLQSIADHFGEMANGTEKNNQLSTLFGRNISGLNEYMTQIAGGGMQKYIDQAKQMGLALSETQIEGIHKLSMNINILKDQFTGIAVILGQAFIPALQGIVSWIGQTVTALTPAIEHFGKFLGMMLGVSTAVQEVAKTTQAMGNNAPWFSMGKDVKGFAPGDLYGQDNGKGGFNYSIGKPIDVVVTNAADIRGGPGHDFGAGGGDAALVLSPFEQAVQSLVESIKADWPIFEQTLKDSVFNLSKIDWKSFADVMVRVVNGLTDFMNGPVGQVLGAQSGKPIKGAEGTAWTWIGEQQAGTNQTNSAIMQQLVNLFSGKGFSVQAVLDAKTIQSINPVTVPIAAANNLAVTTRLDDFNTNSVNYYGDLKKNLDSQKTTNDGLKATLDNINNFLPKLPGLITSAVVTGK